MGDVRLDSLPVVPSSIQLEGIDTSYYSVDATTSMLIWKKKTNIDSILITYRIFPFRFDSDVRRFNYDSVKNNFIAQHYNSDNKTNGSTGILDFGGINYNGSFGRSLSFGNSQDAVFNSQLNLQLSGMIGDSIQIAAAITDNNIPIQPDGTTQQLNEFDKILLQFKKKNWELDLGDIDVRQNQLYFLNFYKRLQGASYQQQNKIGKNGYNKAFVSGAIAKGKFTRNVLQPQEGNQGPYRLQGANNEFYFIVLANTERVFIDGELMQRGQDQDYVINYNTAEVTFTPKHLITKDKRIQIEFEYADRNFLNSLLYVNDELAFSKRFKINIAAYSNVDAKNSPINQQLDPNQKQFLADLGDSIQNAYYPSFTIDSFNASKIQYKQIDSVVNTLHYSIYVYSTSPDSARYDLTFVSVGNNNGNYIPLYNNANGNVYQWVVPINGVKQGSFEPAAFLATPKKQQLVTLASEYKISNKTLLKTDLALSNYDANTYSLKDKSDNTGYAGRLILQNNEKIVTSKRMLLLNTTLSDEWVNQNFKPLERLRGVEFARDWGLSITNTNPVTEHLPQLNIELKDSLNNSLKYNIAGYFRSDAYNGVKQNFQNSNTINNWQIKSNFSLVNDDAPDVKGYLFRPYLEANRLLPHFHHYVVGVSYLSEKNLQKNKIADSLNALSYADEVITAFLKSDQTKKNKWSLSYFTRSDKLPYQKNLLETGRSNNYNASIELLQSKQRQLRINVTYRQLKVSNTNISNLTPDNSLVGRAEYAFKSKNGFVNGITLYELGTGQEQKKDYSYLQVPAGQGQYAWIDYNGDGIPQLNEFVLALFPDQALYIRVYTPTNVYVRTNYTQFNYNIEINPRALLEKGNQHSQSLLSRFILRSSLQAAKKILADGNPSFNPFAGKIADTAILTMNYSFSNVLSFNRLSSKWGADLSRVTNYSKTFLTYGLETRRSNEWSLKARANITKQYSFSIVQKVGDNDLTTPAFGNQNYQIDVLSTEPQFTFINGTRYRLQGSYLWSSKQNNQANGGERSSTNGINIDAKLNAVNSISLHAKFTYSNISFAGLTNTTVSYIMLDGLLPGKNYLWGLEFTKRLSNSLEVSFNYDGREPSGSRVIHTGRASIRALL